MILSRTSQYAVQALIYMATQPAATPVLNKDIAAQLGVPAPYLAKILQSKRAYRQRLAARPIEEKLALLDALRERALVLRPAHPVAGVGVLREEPPQYQVQTKQAG